VQTMSFEMSLPHPPRIQSVAVDGTEVVAHDEKQWQLYYSVQAALKKVCLVFGASGQVLGRCSLQTMCAEGWHLVAS
jgi:hypothetical protein